MHQGAGQGDALLLAAGEAVGEGLGAIQQAHGLQQRLGALADLGRAGPVQLQRQHHVLPHGERRDQVEELEDEADVAAAKEGALAVVQRRQLLPAQPQPAAVGPVDAAEQVEQGALAAAAAAQDGDELALGELGVGVGSTTRVRSPSW